jgi:hypothetical protein
MAANTRALNIDASLVEIRPLSVGRLGPDDSYRKMVRQPVTTVRRIGNWMKTLALSRSFKPSTRHRHRPQATAKAGANASFLQRTTVNWRVRHSVIVFVMLDGRFPSRRFLNR